MRSARAVRCGLYILPSLMLAMSLGTAHGAEYFVDPALRLTGQYDSNPRQDRTDEQDAYGGVLDTALGLGARSPVSLFTLVPRVQVYRFDESDLDRTDYAVSTLMERSLSTQFKARLSGEYSKVSLLDDPQDDATGNSRRDRHTWTATPLLSWQVATRDALEAEYSYTDAMYEDESSGFSDYDDQTASLRWKRQWTPATLGTVEGFVSRYRNLDDGSETEDVGGRLGIETAMSPTLTLLGAVGYADSHFECDTDVIVDSRPDCSRDASSGLRFESDNGNLLGRLELRKRFSANSGLNVGYERSTGASGRGVRTVKNKYTFGLEQTLGERTGFRLSGLFQRNELDATVDRGGESNDIARVQTELRYETAENWFVGFGYRFRYRKDEESDGSSSPASESHIPFVFVSYDGPQHTVVR